jgi:FkbM family methyltransferase
LPHKKFRVLLRNLMYLRNFEGSLRALAEQGHEIQITSSIHDRKVPKELQDRALKLEEEFPNLSFGVTYEREDYWANLEVLLQSLRNFLRYQRPEYRNAPALAARAEKRVPAAARLLFKVPGMRAKPVLAALTYVVRAMDMAIPADKTIRAELAEFKPDALVVSPVVDLGSEQNAWLRAAREEGVPSCLLVASWDNLTNKGLILTPPDKVVLWNDFQKTEAVTMHGIPASAVVPTGAQLYDDWFDRQPSTSYATFCERFGFDATKPTILYCGSSIFIARNEAEFVRKWLTLVRESDSKTLAEANILVRPHPMHQVPFEHLEVDQWGRVAVHPRTGGMPVNEDSRADYFDAIYHCSAVVGINTSALIEASIQGKRSFTVSDPTYAKTQEGTLHFRYLVDGGILQRAATFAEHQTQLEAELSGPAEKTQAQVLAFVESFLRPNGLDKPATPQVAQAMVETAALGHHPRERCLPLKLVGALLWPLAGLVWLVANGRRTAFNFAHKVIRRLMFMLSRAKRVDGIELLALSMPVDYEKAPFSILATSPKESVTRTRSVMKEPWTVHWLENVLKPDEVLYDIGANVGTYSLLAARFHGKGLRVFAFEPGYSTFAALCRNILHNKCHREITPISTLLYSAIGNSVFKYRSTESGAARHAVGAQGLESKDLKETKAVYEQTMLTVTLDSLVDQFGLPVPSHIKLDVDGPELEILKGAEKVLSNPALKTIMVELDEKKLRPGILEILERNGLTLAMEFDKGTRQPTSDAFFAKDPDAIRAIMETSPRKPSLADPDDMDN